MHKLLERQLRRSGLLESLKALPEAWQAFLETVHQAYEQSDTDRVMLERSLDLTSKELTQRNADLRHQQRVLNDLTRSRSIYLGSLQETLGKLTEAMSKTLGVERAGVWFFNTDQSKIVCSDLYQKSQDQHSSGAEISTTEHPAYFLALAAERTVAAHDAQHDARTCDFAETHFKPLGITSSLSVSISFQGKVVGLITNGHVGSPREWTLEDRQFASSIADVVSLAMEIGERRRAEEEITAAYGRLRQTQAQLVETEKLAMLGKFAAGIAHEIKNPLAIILQGENYLRHVEGLQSPEKQEVLLLMRSAVNRADHIVRSLLDLARPAALRLGNHDFHVILDSAFSLAIKPFNPNAYRITKNYTQESVSVNVDEDQMQQVFINLVVNALQAMPAGGELTIRTYTKTISADDSGVGRRATDYFKLGDRVVACEIADTGCGIPANKIAKVFDPFYTTKPRGEGTGLGLSIVRAIIEAHRGLIAVRTQEGRGTCFTVLLPLSQ